MPGLPGRCLARQGVFLVRREWLPRQRGVARADEAGRVPGGTEKYSLVKFNMYLIV